MCYGVLTSLLAVLVECASQSSRCEYHHPTGPCSANLPMHDGRLGIQTDATCAEVTYIVNGATHHAMTDQGLIEKIASGNDEVTVDKCTAYSERQLTALRWD
jgi:hypothetical protein